ncbi:transglutaminase domain-containing protein [Thermodesulfobacteriota bacterium]
MIKRCTVIFLTLFYLLLTIFIQYEKVNAAQVTISPELKSAFDRLNTLGAEMTKVTDDLKSNLTESKGLQSGDVRQIITKYSIDAQPVRQWDNNHIDSAQVALDLAFNELTALDESIKAALSDLERLIGESSLPNSILDRHRAFIVEYENTFAELNILYEDTRLSQMDLITKKNGLSRIQKSPDQDKAVRSTIQINVSKILTKLNANTTSNIDVDENDPERPPSGQNVFMKERKPKTGGTHIPLYLAPQMSQTPTAQSGMGIMSAPSQQISGARDSGSMTPPQADAFTQTIDTEMIQELTDLAATLNHDPINIYEWVLNNIAFQSYYGSAKGAGKTYYDRAGNDFDTASLLIALYRESGIPCRYVYGTIRLTAEQANNMFGTDSAVTGATILSRGGTPVTWDGFEMLVERCWVEAYVPYDNYRGNQGAPGGDIWLPLDPSFKEYSYTGINIAEQAIPDWKAFWSEFFENGITQFTAVDMYQDKIAEYVALNLPDKTIDDVKFTRTIVPENLEMLPLSLPYDVESIHEDYSEIPDVRRHKVRFKALITDADLPYDAETTFDVTLPTVSTACKRMTVGTVGATPADQAIIDSFGDLYLTPLYLVDTKFAFMLNGEILTSSDPIPSNGNGPYYLRAYDILPAGVQFDTSSGLYSGTFGIKKYPIRAYSTVGVGYVLNGFSDEYTQKQLEIFDSYDPNLSHDDYFGQIVYTNAAYFYNKSYKADKLATDLRHVSFYQNYSSYSVFNLQPRINSFMGGATSCEPFSFLTQVMMVWTTYPLHNESVDWNISKVMGCTTSQIEGFTYRDIYRLPPGSAVTFIQYVYSLGGSGHVVNGWTDDDPNTHNITTAMFQYKKWVGWTEIKNGYGGGWLLHGGLVAGATGTSDGSDPPESFDAVFDPEEIDYYLHSPPLKPIGYFYSWDPGLVDRGEVGVTTTLKNGGIEIPYPTDPNDITFPYDSENNKDPFKAQFDLSSVTFIADNTYKLKATYEAPFKKGTKTYDATFTIEVKDPVPATTAVFTFFPTGDSPDSSGNVYVSAYDFEHANWQFDFDDPESVYEIWKDGVKLPPTTTVANLKTMGPGVYIIYFSDGSMVNGRLVTKSVTIWVGGQSAIGEEIFTVGGVPRPTDSNLNFHITINELNTANNWMMNDTLADKYTLLKVTYPDHSFLGDSLNDITSIGEYIIYYKHKDKGTGSESIHTVRAYAINIIFTGYNRKIGAGYMADPPIAFYSTAPNQEGFLRNNDRIVVECEGISSTTPVTIFVLNEANNTERTIFTANPETRAGGIAIHRGTFIVNSDASIKNGGQVKVTNEDKLKPYLVPIGTPLPMSIAEVANIPFSEMAGSAPVNIDIAEVAAADSAWTRTASASCPLTNDDGPIDGYQFMQELESENFIGDNGDPLTGDYETNHYKKLTAADVITSGNKQPDWDAWLGGIPAPDIFYINGHGSDLNLSGMLVNKNPVCGGVCDANNLSCSICFSISFSMSMGNDFFAMMLDISDLDWLIVSSCSVLENINDTVTSLLPPTDVSPYIPTNNNSPLHGVLGYRGNGLGGDPANAVATSFVNNLTTSNETMINSWMDANLTNADGTVHVDIPDDPSIIMNYKIGGSNLHAIAYTRQANILDGLPPHNIMTSDSWSVDSSDPYNLKTIFSVSYLVYQLDYVPIGDPARLNEEFAVDEDSIERRDYDDKTLSNFSNFPTGEDMLPTTVLKTLPPENIYYRDSDGDGYGHNEEDDPSDPDDIIEGYTLPSGYSVVNTDCNDDDASINPGVYDICGNRVDTNCDGSDGMATGGEVCTEWYRDSDGDCSGNPNNSIMNTPLMVISGYSTLATDTNDSDCNLPPPSLCDVCNQNISIVWYQDLDNDCFGDPAVSTTADQQPTGYVANNLDTNDNDCNIPEAGQCACAGN